MIFDTHCHLGFHDEDPAAVRRRAADAGVTTILDVGIDLDSSRAARARAMQLSGVHYSAGLHPNDAGALAEQWEALAELGAEPGCAAIGETGLDFYRDRTTPAQQEAAFERHLQLALALHKPVVVHCRDAFARTYEVLAAHQGVRGVMHCFSGGIDEARTALGLGLHLSFAGPLTYPRSQALCAAARFAPADALLVETDAPFLPPQGRRGQRNEPAYIVATLAKLAEERQVPLAEMAATTMANGCRLFGIAPASSSP